MSPSAVPTGRPARVLLLRAAGVALATLLLVLGVAASLGPDVPPDAPPTPSTSAEEPPSPTPSPTPTPTPAPTETSPPELDPPLMTGSIRVGERPVAVALDGVAGLGFTANLDGGDVSVIDLASGVVTDTVAIPGRPSAVATGPSGMVYVADRSGGRVHVIDLASGERVSSWKVGKRPVALALDVERGRLYVAVRAAVEVYDTSSGKRVASLHVDAPSDLAFDVHTRQVWVLSGDTGTVAIHDPRSGDWTATGFSRAGATGMEVDGERGRLYLTGPGRTLEEWDVHTATVRRLSLPEPAAALRIDPASLIAYLADPDGNCVIAVSVA